MTNREKRCEDCVCLIEKNKRMCCDELWGELCDNIEECPEGVELEEINNLNEKAKAIRITNAADKPKKEKTERKTKVSAEKTRIFNTILDILNEKYNVNVLNDNKLIEIELNGKKFKVNLTETRIK